TSVDGRLSRDGLFVALDADVHASARFARWLRSIVPSTQPLAFYDEGYTADVPLTAETPRSSLRGHSWSTDGAPPPTTGPRRSQIAYAQEQRAPHGSYPQVVTAPD